MTSAPQSKLHILHTENSLGWGGQELRILTEAEGFVKRDHDVAIACPREARLFDEGKKRGLDMIDVSIAKRSVRGLLAIRALAASGRFDIINTHSSTDSWLTALACRTLGTPPAIVRTRHISAPVPDNFATRWLYRQAAHTVTTGERLRETLISDVHLPPNQVTSVPTGIDLDQFKPGDRQTARAALALPQDVFIVGIVATLRSWKGHTYLLDAVTSLPGVYVVVVGDGPQHDSLRQQATLLQISQRLHFAGNQHNVAPWLQALDVFVLPSYANEGVPQAILQAAATGLPIVSTPIGSITEAIEHERTGLIVAAKDSAAIASALARLRNDFALRERLGAAAREEAVARFGAAKMVESMERVFRLAKAGSAHG